MDRTADLSRDTNETRIKLSINLDGRGTSSVRTGVGFFDHMLDLLAKHALIDLTVQADGDLHVDQHHTIEDVGLLLGQAIDKAVGDKRGIYRYGWANLPMDESLARVALDLSGRPAFVFSIPFNGPLIGDFAAELVEEFFKALSNAAKINLHIDVPYGRNNHHMAEATFKAFARALRQAVTIDPRAADQVPSTKGTLIV
ncbi:MAG TPA: imidazoleglycerol-phosphate dehydratase HisB [Tepidisphaeraceae bacterium]|jgi:imidazoleglycerol-phosphate dehydratase